MASHERHHPSEEQPETRNRRQKRFMFDNHLRKSHSYQYLKYTPSEHLLRGKSLLLRYPCHLWDCAVCGCHDLICRNLKGLTKPNWFRFKSSLASREYLQWGVETWSSLLAGYFLWPLSLGYSKRSKWEKNSSEVQIDDLQAKQENAIWNIAQQSNVSQVWEGIYVMC